MEFGVILATVMIALLATLTPDTNYWYEAAIMVTLGFGLGFVMPVMNIAVQNEFEQRDLGVATSSIQLFRGLGSTIGIAIFGAMLTNGLTANLADVNKSDYVMTLSQSKEAKRIGDLTDANTLLTLNMPDVKEQISDGFEKAMDKSPLPAPVKKQIEDKFKKDQKAYNDAVVDAFTKSLRRIFITSAVLMLFAAVIVFFIREKELSHASASSTPGEI